MENSIKLNSVTKCDSTAIEDEAIARLLRNAAGSAPTSVCVVTCKGDGGEDIGLTIGSYASLSLKPALWCWSLQNASRSLRHFREGKPFCISVLAAGQQDVAQAFVRKGEDRFEGVSLARNEVGLARITGAAAWFDCTLARMVDAGDHQLFIGSIDAFASFDAPPLLHWRGRYAAVAA